MLPDDHRLNSPGFVVEPIAPIKVVAPVAVLQVRSSPWRVVMLKANI